MAKSSKIVDRPRPPTFNEIKSDIVAAGTDDVVFCLGDGSSNKSSSSINKSVVMDESYLDISPASEGELSEFNNTKSEQELVYQNVLELLQLNQQLEQAPQRLQKGYDKLEELGAEVSKSIDVLKESSSSFTSGS